MLTFVAGKVMWTVNAGEYRAREREIQEIYTIRYLKSNRGFSLGVCVLCCAVCALDVSVYLFTCILTVCCAHCLQMILPVIQHLSIHARTHTNTWNANITSFMEIISIRNANVFMQYKYKYAYAMHVLVVLLISINDLAVSFVTAKKEECKYPCIREYQIDRISLPYNHPRETYLRTWKVMCDSSAELEMQFWIG